MAITVNIVDRIPQAVRIGIEPTSAERAKSIRAVKAHQSCTVGTLAVANQITIWQ
jgi:hypothetical protein